MARSAHARFGYPLRSQAVTAEPQAWTLISDAVGDSMGQGRLVDQVVLATDRDLACDQCGVVAVPARNRQILLRGHRGAAGTLTRWSERKARVFFSASRAAGSSYSSHRPSELRP